MTLYLRHPSGFEHDTGAHPESYRRLVAIEEALAERDWLGAELVEAPAASREQLKRVHDDAHVDRIERLSQSGGANIDLDTIVSEGTWEAALHAAGGAAEAVDRLMSGQDRFAFCGLRPPGHHAEADRAMGFCIFNNVAVAATQALVEHGAERVLVLDWDVHHGNGTEAIFAASSEVLYASIHQSPLYPGTGGAKEVGRGAGEGYTVNLPVPPGTGPDLFLSLVQGVVAPIAREWRPGLLCISAGYDAHRDDPLAQCMLDERCYAEMTAAMRDLAGELGVGLLICLEGGYALEALAASVLATLEALPGSEPPRSAPQRGAEPYRRGLAPYWPVLSG